MPKGALATRRSPLTVQIALSRRVASSPSYVAMYAGRLASGLLGGKDSNCAIITRRVRHDVDTAPGKALTARHDVVLGEDASASTVRLVSLAFGISSSGRCFEQ